MGGNVAYAEEKVMHTHKNSHTHTHAHTHTHIHTHTHTYIYIYIYIYILPSRLGLQNTPTVPLQRGKTPNKCPVFDIKQSDGEVWGVRSALSLPLIPGPLWPGVVAPDRVLSLSQIELNCVLMLN